ncbi:LLM class flavin-dependent oxidoreductase [Herbiconiux moechotypicola]|uniref:Luciferase-like domain-containing protein n=1 Tax=Herbiconiux moechotypicola TaxID=637393 RepID=A0ABN3DL72_9MICO|nr:LLM class flavin-dependent oxidoreductase [Herbiconiux moechotypicola]MCS5730097.1 LLM class flavin-dependent oxidoreductase [Herbiconiux moechotypicola]
MIAVNVMPVDALQVVRAAQSAEAAGVPTLVLPDNGARTRDGWVALGAAAMCTDRMRLGLITNPFTRRPEVTAGALATLDEVSGGRGLLILSAGGAYQLASMGAQRSQPLDALAESIAIVRDRHPAGRLWLATKGPKTLELAAARADGVLLSGIPFSLLGGLVLALREQAPALTVALTLHHRFDEASDLASRERVVYELLNMRPEYREAAGVPGALVSEVSAAVAEAGPVAAAALVPERVIAEFCLDGPRNEVVARAEALARDTGLDEVVLPERSLLP